MSISPIVPQFKRVVVKLSGESLQGGETHGLDSITLDRIADEGYIDSAVEAESIFYLASAIGYRAWPGVAAST